jgi:hypothetical protein
LDRSFPMESLLPFGSRRRTWARRVYKKVVALTGRNTSTYTSEGIGSLR